PFVSVKISVVLSEIPLQKHRVDILGQGVHAGILIVYEHLCMSLARCGNSELPHECHRQTFVHQRRVLSICAKNEISQAEKRVLTFVTAEFNLEGRLDIAAASFAVRADRDLRTRDVASLEGPVKFDRKVAFNSGQWGNNLACQRVDVLLL